MARDYMRYKIWQRVVIGFAWVFYPFVVWFLNPDELLPRRDEDWDIGESVQVVVNPRSKKREPLGVAMIIGIDQWFKVYGKYKKRH